MGEIFRRNYPELDKLLWDFHAPKITAEFAFQTYEERWKFVDKAKIEQDELQFIDELTALYGNGVFMAA